MSQIARIRPGDLQVESFSRRIPAVAQKQSSKEQSTGLNLEVIVLRSACKVCVLVGVFYS